jgi:CobQ-like glutamine amidotransferase family enzyme
MTFTIVHLLPELLGTYGDKGNVEILSWRLSKREIAHQVLLIGVGDEIPTSADLYLLGGGEDDAQIAALEILGKKNSLQKALGNGAHIFAVCAGFQILGTQFPASGDRIITGLGLIGVETVSAKHRSVGELLTRPSVPIAMLTGFENHAGQTRFIDELQPLGHVLAGIGNGQGSNVDGLITPQVVATYMHGPAFARNPELADWILSRKIGNLPTLLAPIFEQLHDERVSRTK